MSSTNTERTHFRGILLIGAAACLWGTVGVASKVLYGLGDAAPITIGFYRLALASLVLLAQAVAVLGPGRIRVARADWLPLILIGLSQGAYQGLYFGAVETIGVILATLIALCSAPVLVAALSAAFLRERLGRGTLAAIGVAVVGVGLLVGRPAPGAIVGAAGLIGVTMAAGAALAYAIFALSSWSLAGRYHPAVLIGLGFGMGAVMLAPFAVWFGLSVPGGAAAWGTVLYMGLIATALAYCFFYVGLRSAVPSATGILALFEPLTATLLAALLFGESLSPAGLIGAALLLAAMILLARTSGARPRQGATRLRG